MEIALLLVFLAIGIALLVRYRLKENQYLKLEFRPRNPKKTKFDRSLEQSFQKAAQRAEEKKLKNREPKS